DREPSADFSRRLLTWYRDHGRRDLPWQREPTPYRVWVSEIMLQQTRVAIVVPYFERFVGRFPDVRVLAEAPLDEVLYLWSRLGYYARGRNLHAAARIACERYAGALPEDLPGLMTLPGIGRSTAGAILALALGQNHAILDGNVKRVLCRYHAIGGWPGSPPVERRLWMLAERHTPAARVAEYTQAIMDLGARLCTRTAPACGRCPIRHGCLARRHHRQTELPRQKIGRPLPVRRTGFLILQNGTGEVLLERRPPAGLWGGLWAFPECPADGDPETYCRSLGLKPLAIERGHVFRHVFTHFRLEIQPIYMNVRELRGQIMEGGARVWYNKRRPAPLGLATPVATLLGTTARPGP
ncbi:MAG TPA: A/G-specific adenine glycosylase, partial [Propionibacteriaceae bacterium]|nr:A/G-specific adenine glycosylase [Propionibacteriaceae bacterium]